MEKIILKATDNVFIRDGGGEVGCGTINNDGHLYFIDKPNGVASRLPDKYKDTPMYLIPSCGGYQDGLIMVSLYGKLDLQYYHEFSGSAGMWGWIDLEGNEVIPPQYIYAYSFEDGEAIVCKGVWEIDDQNRYWCKNEKWGIINTKGEEILPLVYDKIWNFYGKNRFSTKAIKDGVEKEVFFHDLNPALPQHGKYRILKEEPEPYGHSPLPASRRRRPE